MRYGSSGQHSLFQCPQRLYITGEHVLAPPRPLVADTASGTAPHSLQRRCRERQAAYTISYKHLLLAILDENPYLSAGSKQALATTAGLAVQNSSRITVLMVDAHEPSGDPAVRLETIQWCARAPSRAPHGGCRAGRAHGPRCRRHLREGGVAGAATFLEKALDKEATHNPSVALGARPSPPAPQRRASVPSCYTGLGGHSLQQPAQAARRAGPSAAAQGRLQAAVRKVATGKPGEPGLGRFAGDVADEVEADLLLLSSEAVHSKARRAPAGTWRVTSRGPAAARRLSKWVAFVRRRWMPTCSPSLSAAQVRLQAARCRPAAPRLVLVSCRTDSDWCGRSAPPALRSAAWCMQGAACWDAAAVGPCA